MTIFDQNFFSKCKLSLSDDIDMHACWIVTNIYHKEFKNKNEKFLKRFGMARLGHGAQHVCRTAIYAKIISNYLLRYGKNIYSETELDKLNINNNIKLLQIVALLHDSGREGDQKDEWDDDSAVNCYKYLTIVLGIDSEEARTWAERIANKSYKRNKKYKNLIVSGTIKNPIFDWDYKEKIIKEDILIDIIHDVDALDIFRARKFFDPDRLYIYEELLKIANKDATILYKKILFSIERLILQQDSFPSVNSNWAKVNSSIIKKKIVYENNVNCYKKTLEDISLEIKYDVLKLLYKGGGDEILKKLKECIRFCKTRDLWLNKYAVMFSGDLNPYKQFRRVFTLGSDLIYGKGEGKYGRGSYVSAVMPLKQDSGINKYRERCKYGDSSKNSREEIEKMKEDIKKNVNRTYKFPFVIVDALNFFIDVFPEDQELPYYVQNFEKYLKKQKDGVGKNGKEFSKNKISRIIRKEKCRSDFAMAYYRTMRYCKEGIVFVTKKTGGAVHFVLGAIDMKRLLRPEGVSFTGSELKAIYRNRYSPEIMNHIVFWLMVKDEDIDLHENLITKAPWEPDPKSYSPFWQEYKPKSQQYDAFKIAAALAGLKTIDPKSKKELENFFKIHYEEKHSKKYVEIINKKLTGVKQIFQRHIKLTIALLDNLPKSCKLHTNTLHLIEELKSKLTKCQKITLPQLTIIKSLLRCAEIVAELLNKQIDQEMAFESYLLLKELDNDPDYMCFQFKIFLEDKVGERYKKGKGRSYCLDYHSIYKIGMFLEGKRGGSNHSIYAMAEVFDENYKKSLQELKEFGKKGKYKETKELYIHLKKIPIYGYKCIPNYYILKTAVELLKKPNISERRYNALIQRDYENVDKIVSNALRNFIKAVRLRSKGSPVVPHQSFFNPLLKKVSELLGSSGSKRVSEKSGLRSTSNMRLKKKYL